jgi:hypothetical protein
MYQESLTETILTKNKTLPEYVIALTRAVVSPGLSPFRYDAIRNAPSKDIIIIYKNLILSENVYSCQSSLNTF